MSWLKKIPSNHAAQLGRLYKDLLMLGFCVEHADFTVQAGELPKVTLVMNCWAGTMHASNAMVHELHGLCCAPYDVVTGMTEHEFHQKQKDAHTGAEPDVLVAPLAGGAGEGTTPDAGACFVGDQA